MSGGTYLLPERRRKLRQSVLQAQLADEGHERGDARHAHHERKVALDGLADARVAHLHRHHNACGSERGLKQRLMEDTEGCWKTQKADCLSGVPHASQQPQPKHLSSAAP